METIDTDFGPRSCSTISHTQKLTHSDMMLTLLSFGTPGQDMGYVRLPFLHQIKTPTPRLRNDAISDTPAVARYDILMSPRRLNIEPEFTLPCT